MRKHSVCMPQAYEKKYLLRQAQDKLTEDRNGQFIIKKSLVRRLRGDKFVCDGRPDEIVKTSSHGTGKGKQVTRLKTSGTRYKIVGRFRHVGQGDGGRFALKQYTNKRVYRCSWACFN